MNTTLLLILLFIFSILTVYVLAMFMKKSTKTTLVSTSQPVVSVQKTVSPPISQDTKQTTIPLNVPTPPQTQSPMCCQNIDVPDAFFKSCKRTCAQFGQMSCIGQNKQSCEQNVSSCMFTSNGCVSKPDAPKMFMKSIDMSICDANPEKQHDCL